MAFKVTPRAAGALIALTMMAGCRNAKPLFADQPRLNQDVRLQDETVSSKILKRNMRLRIVTPRTPDPKQPLPVLYLLHGAGVDARDWTNNSDIAELAQHNVMLVMPYAEDAFYINEAYGADAEYENYFFRELIPAVHRLQPSAATDRADTAIAGISRGGYGAVVLGLHHPELFSFIGDMSGALDLGERRFRLFSALQSLRLERAFGPQGSATRRDNDPLLLIRSAKAGTTPYIFVSCGEMDPLFNVNRAFNRVLAERSVPHEFHVVEGAHNWSSWNKALPLLENALLEHLRGSSDAPANARSSVALRQDAVLEGHR